MNMRPSILDLQVALLRTTLRTMQEAVLSEPGHETSVDGDDLRAMRAIEGKDDWRDLEAPRFREED